VIYSFSLSIVCGTLLLSYPCSILTILCIYFTASHFDIIEMIYNALTFQHAPQIMMKSSDISFALKESVTEESGDTTEVDVQSCKKVSY
jgi:hypothetical protein